MKGLLIKDFALLKNQKRMFMAILLMFILFSATGALDTGFIMGYLPFVFCIYVMSSISYDEFDNGLSFLMVLPTSRKQYAAEKYIFGICMGMSGLAAAVILATGLKIVNYQNADLEQWFMECLFTVGFLIFFVGIFLAVMIPIQIKFGSEKGRILLFGIAMSVVAVGYLISKYAKQIPAYFNKIAGFLTHVNSWLLLLLLFAATIVILFISYGISAHIMEKKEF